AWLPAAGVGPPLALAVSDGHGDRRCFRSDVGARLAVETGSHLLMEFLDCPFDPNNLSLIKHTAEDRLSEGLVRSWRQEVEKHLAENPFRQEEWDFLREKVGEEARSAIENDPFLAYGATLLLAAVTETYLLCMQLGDGDSRRTDPVPPGAAGSGVDFHGRLFQFIRQRGRFSPDGTGLPADDPVGRDRSGPAETAGIPGGNIPQGQRGRHYFGNGDQPHPVGISDG
ncbi:MAG: protein phosphatase 2C domain-containing protein, partial [Coprothermobacterota bacterium]|nr:protein phosphatase 2C domain-containing protein [Coprothermobacterota bacterium]